MEARDTVTEEYLAPNHWEMLIKGSSMSQKVIEERGYYTATEPDELSELGFA
jgi:hypothetical protein